MADGFPKETFAFLRGISKNNKKPWFETLLPINERLRT